MVLGTFDSRWGDLTIKDLRTPDLSDPLDVLPIQLHKHHGRKEWTTNGVTRRTIELVPNRPARTDARWQAWQLNLNIIRAAINSTAEVPLTAITIRESVLAEWHIARQQPPDLDLDDEGSPEGHALERLHLIRERDPKLRASKIYDTRRKLGHIRCEVCNFDFEQFYGRRGRDYIECHHKVALSLSGSTRTTLNDLALLCSNCHRMIHCTRPWITIEELRNLVSEHSNVMNGLSPVR